MIFFTLGTEQYPFQRMVDAADLVAAALPEEEVFVQIGTHPAPPKLARHERWLSYPDFAARIRDARVVVTHAGAGSLLSCAWIGKVAVTAPRRHQFGEHVDDHQTELAARMAELGHALLGETAEELARLVLEYDVETAELLGRGRSSPTLPAALDRYLDQIGERRR
ncbi:MAG: hypothetical protein ISR76_10830 [Planctomycetes bacterium]|nr:hypothetical protein [Planctomycetota bacterium]MBL7009484.1 hypothetical protein [Planctomycetota bacterium]